MNEKAVMDLPLWSDPDTGRLFKKMCSEAGISPALMRDLIALLREYQHKERMFGLYDDMDMCFQNYEEE